RSPRPLACPLVPYTTLFRSPNIAIKVPLTWDGLTACKAFASEGLKVNVTLCFSPAQAILAAKAGAAFVSPFIGRLDDIHLDGVRSEEHTSELQSRENIVCRL